MVFIEQKLFSFGLPLMERIDCLRFFFMLENILNGLLRFCRLMVQIVLLVNTRDETSMEKTEREKNIA